jgi:hypothetical protein
MSHNLRGQALFLDASNFDYRLQRNSPARNFGAEPGTVNGFSLKPTYQYVHPACFETRTMTGSAIDAGAFEIDGGGGPDAACAPQITVSDFILSSSSVAGGEQVHGTLKLTAPAPAGGVKLALSSSNAAVAFVPASLTIPQGRTSGHFEIVTTNVTATSVTISAVCNTATKSVELRIGAATPAISSLTISPNVVVGGHTTTATVKLLNPSSTDATTVTLMSFPPDIALVPSHINVPAGSTTASFTVKTTVVSRQTHARIGAVYGGVTKMVNLTIAAR